MKFESDHLTNVKQFDKLFNIDKNYDFTGRELLIGGRRAKMYFIDSFIKSADSEHLFMFLSRLDKVEFADASDFAAKYLPYSEVSIHTQADSFITQIMSGTMGIVYEGLPAVGITVDVRFYPVRSITQSENDRVLRGAHDSFIEAVKVNTTLIRRRIRDTRLTFERIEVGEASKTDVVVAYVEGKADSKYVKEITGKIRSVNVEALNLGQQSLAECMIKRGWYDPFPKFRYTERPDVAAAHLLEGKILVICDTSPEVMILPACLLDFMQETDDFYFPPLTGSYLRLLRFLVFLLTLILIPTWYLLITHEAWVPEWLGFILVKREYNIPILLQIYIIELAIDGLKLASMNTPSSLNNTFGVVGGLILGDFAVQIGWFIPEVIVYMSFVAIAGFSQSSYELGYTFKFLRMLLLLTTALFGLVGYIGGFVLIIALAAVNTTANGRRSYLYPLIPFNKRAFKRLFVREQLNNRKNQVKRK